MWAQVFAAVFSLIVAAITAPKPKNKTPKPAGLEDFDVPQHTEGTAQIWVFGDVWISDWFVLGYGDIKTSPIKK
jgi:hypothetical protein